MIRAALRRPIDEAAFTAWLLRAEAGAQLTYWRGHLAIDASPLASQLPADERVRLQAVSDLAWRVAQQGWIHLVQQRHGASDVSYVAIVRPRSQVLAHALPRTLTEAIA